MKWLRIIVDFFKRIFIKKNRDNGTPPDDIYPLF